MKGSVFPSSSEHFASRKDKFHPMNSSTSKWEVDRFFFRHFILINDAKMLLALLLI